MKRLLVVIAIMSMVGSSTLAWAQLLPHFKSGDVLHAVDLNDIVDHILGVGIPQTITVDCGAGGTIGQALEQAAAGDTIQVIGRCNEAVLITKFGITLDGQGQTTIDATGQTDTTGQPRSAITINGAHRVTIKGLTIQHGNPHGLFARRGAAVLLTGVTAQDNVMDGIRIDESSTAQLTDCTAQGNGRDGIRTFRNGSASLSGTIVSQNNQADGIHVTIGSVALINTGAIVTVSGNTDQGLQVGEASEVTMSPGSSGTATLVAQGNGDRGILVFENGTLSIQGGTMTVQNNATGGVQALRTSSVRFQSALGSALTVQILNNQGPGVELDQTANARLNGSLGGATIAIHDNMTDGLAVFSDSHLEMNNVIVRDNQGNGINVNLSTANLTNVQILNHTNASGLILGAGSRANASQLTVMNNSNANIGNAGIQVNDKSSLNLSGTSANNSIVSGNLGTGGGLNLFNGSTASLNNVQILGNTNGTGLNINLGSSVFAQNLTVTNNGNANIFGPGISVGEKSSFNTSSASTSPVTVSSNQGTGGGINLSRGSSANLQNVQITNHPHGVGLNVGQSSSAGATNVTVTTNTSPGVRVDDGSSLILQNAALTGNGSTDLFASFGARLTLNPGNVIGICSHDASVLIRGSTIALCP